MIDLVRSRGVMLLILMSLACQASAQQRAAEAITYRGQSGVLDATGEASTDQGSEAELPASPAANRSGKTAAEPSSDSSARRGLSGFSGNAPFPGAAENGGEEAAASKASSTRPLVTVTSSLAIVLGLFAGLVWLMRRSGGKPAGQLPEEVFALLGRTALGPRQNITFARCGRRILVLAVSPSATSTLAEITDPDEVADLVAQCGNGGPRQLFQRTLKEMGEQEPAAPGFIDPIAERPSRGLFVSG